jgi:hypothetical protein
MGLCDPSLHHRLETSYEAVVHESQPKLIVLAHQSEYPPNNLSMKEGSLFCFVLFCRNEIHQTGMLQIMFMVSLESSQSEAVHGP